MRPEIRDLQASMRRQGYIAERSIVTAVHLARAMEKPLLIEGDAGVGKTEVAKVMAAVLGTELIRLQCYEGLDVNTALYEWNYQKQLLRLRIAAGERAAADQRTAADERAAADQRTAADERAASRPSADPEAGGRAEDGLEDIIFGRRYLLERPLLRAITRPDAPPVLLIDEIDRADEGFEAFLLEVLSDFQVTIPELGTIRAEHRPAVILTSNRTREIGDALRRRCLYLYIEHPPFEKEVEIVRTRVPGIAGRLAAEITHFVQALRRRSLMKPPGVAETLDWAHALVTLHKDALDTETVAETLGCLVKDRHDMREMEGDDLQALTGEARAEAADEARDGPVPGGARGLVHRMGDDFDDPLDDFAEYK